MQTGRERCSTQGHRICRYDRPVNRLNALNLSRQAGRRHSSQPGACADKPAEICFARGNTSITAPEKGRKSRPEVGYTGGSGISRPRRELGVGEARHLTMFRGESVPPHHAPQWSVFGGPRSRAQPHLAASSMTGDMAIRALRGVGRLPLARLARCFRSSSLLPQALPRPKASPSLQPTTTAATLPLSDLCA